jgi:magnesium transporter
MQLFCYRADHYEERILEDLSGLPTTVDGWDVTWVDLDAVPPTDSLKQLGEIFGIHPLVLEDVVGRNQRPKAEAYEAGDFVVMRMVSSADPLSLEQVSLFLGHRCVVSIQDGLPGDCFGPVRERLRAGKGRIRTSGPGYLLYALVDVIVDAYFPVLERYGAELEALEDQVLQSPRPDVGTRLYGLRHDLLTLRRALWPMREAILALARPRGSRLTEDTRTYLRDCEDHLHQLIDDVEACREVASDLAQLYLSSMSNRMNETMTVLAVISTVFIPLSFVAGIYGMNFEPDGSPWNMPELRWYFGYPFALGVMALVALGLVLYLRKKAWLSGTVATTETDPGKAPPG